MKNKKSLILNIVCLVIYIILTLSCVLNHEIWRDEAQVWLVVRDLNLLGIIDHVRIEGHPLLWYLIVLPFAKLGIDVVSMQIISWLFTTIAAGVFLWKSPFNIITKLSVIFSAGFLYWLPVISRSYALIPLFIFLTAILYPTQKEKPFLYTTSLALLSQTHVLMSAFCSAMSFLFFYENIFKNKINKKNYIIPFLITFLPILCLCLYIFTCPHKNESVAHYMLSVNKLFANTYVTYMVHLYGVMTNLKGFFISLLFLISAGIIFIENKKLFCVFLINLIYQFFIYKYIWMSAPEKVWSGTCVLLFCFWIIFLQNNLKKTKKIFYNLVLILLFGLSVNLGLQLRNNDIKYDYSGSKKTANFIKNNIKKDDIIVTNQPIFSSSITAYIKGYKFYYPNTDTFYTYGYDSKADEYLSLEEQEKNFQKFKNKKIYYLYSSVSIPENNLLYKSDKTTLIATERFYILDNLDGKQNNVEN